MTKRPCPVGLGFRTSPHIGMANANDRNDVGSKIRVLRKRFKKRNMRTKIANLLCLMTVIALSSCRVYDDFYSSRDKSVDFTKYKSYAWMKPSDPNGSNPKYNDVIVNNAKSYVDREFKSRGFTVDTVKPDVLVELLLKKEKLTETVQTAEPYNYSNYTYSNYPYNQQYHNNPYYSDPNYNYYSNYNYSTPYSYSPGYSTETIHYTKGTITINVIDRGSNQLVWTGSAEGDIYDPQYLKGEINPAVSKIMEQYPVKSMENK